MRNRRLVISAIILLLLLIVAGYYFMRSSGDMGVVTLSPDHGETKVKPKDPGGMVIPHSDSLVYQKIKKGNVVERKVNLQPEPESPVNMNRAPEAKSNLVNSIDEILANIEYYESQLSEEGGDLEEEYILPNNLLSKENAQAEEDKYLFVPGTKLQIIRALESRYKSLDEHILAEDQDGYKVQLSSANSLPEAKKQWQFLKQKHAKIIKNANLITKRVEGKNERIFFLVMAGTYPSLNHAKLVCRKLTARKQNCIITK